MQMNSVCSRCGTPAVPGETFCGNCGQSMQPAVVATSQTCARCGTLATPGETFCGNCGQSLAAPGPVSPAPLAVAPPKKSSAGKILLAGCLGIIGVLVLAAGAGGIYVWRRSSYTPPVRKAPALPQRAAGTLTEFPVDNDANSPAKPTSVATQTLTPAGTSSSQSLTAGQAKLPPGIDQAALAKGATTMTSATYRAHPGAASSTPSSSDQGTAGKDQVYICVLTAMPNDPAFGEGLGSAVAQATRGDRTGVRVQSPTGSVYSGSRIRSPQTTVYVLTKEAGNIVIIIYAPDPTTQETADRLAQRVGNGEGLNDYPEVKNSLWTLPASTPGDLTLQELNTLTRGEIESSIGNSTSAQNDDTRRILEQMRQFIPERLTAARYSDATRQEWNAMEFEYGSTFQAWRTWLLAKGVLGLSGSQSTTVSGVDALYMDQDGKRILIFQKGPYLVILGGPTAAPVDKLVALGNEFQL